jgi:hypothetical protein
MSTTNGTATGNKRRHMERRDEERVEAGGFAASGSAAGATANATASTAILPSELKSALGSRLQPIMGVLASQPAELKEPLISLSCEMLKLIGTIKQRAEAHLRYTRLMADPKTNQPVLDEDGNPKPFIPSFLRTNNPVKSSSDYNADPEMVAAIEASSKTWEANKNAMSTHLKLIAQLEIKKRNEALQAKFFSLATTFALGLIVVEQTKNGGPEAASNLNRKKLSHKAAYDALRDLPKETSPPFLCQRRSYAHSVLHYYCV